MSALFPRIETRCQGEYDREVPSSVIGSLVMEELYPFLLSGGKTLPDGMKDEKPIHPAPWEVTKAKIEKEKADAKEKDEKEKIKHEAEAKKRKEARQAKKKEMAEKKAAKEKAKSEL